jgi:hypothetical protein
MSRPSRGEEVSTVLFVAAFSVLATLTVEHAPGLLCSDEVPCKAIRIRHVETDPADDLLKERWDVYFLDPDGRVRLVEELQEDDVPTLDETRYVHREFASGGWSWKTRP